MALCESCQTINLHGYSAVLKGRLSYPLRNIMKKSTENCCAFCSWLVETSREAIKQARQVDPKMELWVHLGFLSKGELVSSTREQRDGNIQDGLQINAMSIEVGPRYFTSLHMDKWPVKVATDICVAADLGVDTPLPCCPRLRHGIVDFRLIWRYRKSRIQDKRCDWAVHWL